jgi:hypothetical protein
MVTPAEPIVLMRIYRLRGTPRGNEARMTKQERQRMIAVVRAAEAMFLENIALKLVLEHRAVPNWQPLLARLLSDKEILAGVHLRFRDLYGMGSDDPQ